MHFKICFFPLLSNKYTLIQIIKTILQPVHTESDALLCSYLGPQVQRVALRWFIKIHQVLVCFRNMKNGFSIAIFHFLISRG